MNRIIKLSNIVQAGADDFLFEKEKTQSPGLGVEASQVEKVDTPGFDTSFEQGAEGSAHSTEPTPREKQLLQTIEALEKEKLDFVNQIQKLQTDNVSLEKQLESMHELEYSDGFNQGLAKGEEYAKQQSKVHEDAFSKILVSMEDEISKVAENSEALAVELALLGLGRILKVRSEDEQFVAEHVSKLLEEVNTYYQTIVRVAEPYVTHIEDMLKQKSLSKRISVIADNTLELGECVLENDRGFWDARLDQQLSNFRDALKTKVDR